MNEESPAEETMPEIEVENVPNYLWQAITTTILCCWPIGIPAIIFAAKVNGLLAQGNIEEAKIASAKAKMWCWISLGLGLIYLVCLIAFQGLALIGIATTNSGNF